MTTITPDELRAMLADAGITQGELARRLEVNDRTVRRWASGDVPLDGMAAIAALCVLGHPVVTLTCDPTPESVTSDGPDPR
jgi:DNA-binding transcriptional regulator YiaG